MPKNRFCAFSPQILSNWCSKVVGYSQKGRCFFLTSPVTYPLTWQTYSRSGSQLIILLNIISGLVGPEVISQGVREAVPPYFYDIPTCASSILLFRKWSLINCAGDSIHCSHKSTVHWDIAEYSWYCWISPARHNSCVIKLYCPMQYLNQAREDPESGSWNTVLNNSNFEY